MARFVGVDVGGTNVRSAVWEGGVSPPPAGEAGRLPPDYDSFLSLLEQLVGDGASGVGVGLPGRVSPGGESVEWMPNIGYLDGRGLAAELEARVAAPVRLANDAQLALLGESRFGAAAGAASALLVSIGTGIGGAVMWGGRIVRGANGTTGSFGWLPVAANGGVGIPAGPGATADQLGRGVPPAVSQAGVLAPGAAGTGGDRSVESGGWERLSSGRALESRAARLQPPVAAANLLQEASAGHGDARRLLLEFSSELGVGLAALASTFDPAVVLISGGVSSLVSELLPEITSRFRQAASPSVRATPLAVAQHGHLAGALGAAAFAREREGAFLQ